jgi:hypothetical protein
MCICQRALTYPWNNFPTVRQLIQKSLSQFRLDSIRRRIPAFAIMGKSSAVRQLVQKALLQFRLDSIHGQIVAFAILAALIPSLVISLIAYAQSHRALTEKITQELMTTGSQAGRETDVWLKERLYDLRVFAASSGSVNLTGTIRRKR